MEINRRIDRQATPEELAQVHAFLPESHAQLFLGDHPFSKEVKILLNFLKQKGNAQVLAELSPEWIEQLPHRHMLPRLGVQDIRALQRIISHLGLPKFLEVFHLAQAAEEKHGAFSIYLTLCSSGMETMSPSRYADAMSLLNKGVFRADILKFLAHASDELYTYFGGLNALESPDTYVLDRLLALHPTLVEPLVSYLGKREASSQLDLNAISLNPDVHIPEAELTVEAGLATVRSLWNRSYDIGWLESNCSAERNRVLLFPFLDEERGYFHPASDEQRALLVGVAIKAMGLKALAGSREVCIFTRIAPANMGSHSIEGWLELCKRAAPDLLALSRTIQGLTPFQHEYIASEFGSLAGFLEWINEESQDFTDSMCLLDEAVVNFLLENLNTYPELRRDIAAAKRIGLFWGEFEGLSQIPMEHLAYLLSVSCPREDFACFLAILLDPEFRSMAVDEVNAIGPEDLDTELLALIRELDDYRHLVVLQERKKAEVAALLAGLESIKAQIEASRFSLAATMDNQEEA